MTAFRFYEHSISQKNFTKDKDHAKGPLLAGRDCTVHYLEGCRIFKKNVIPLAHLPTFFLLIGYPVFWLELYLIPHADGRTSPLAWILFLGLSLFLIFDRVQRRGRRRSLSQVKKKYKELDSLTKVWLLLGKVFIALILIFVVYEYLLPPHLVQESDVLTYHLTIPKQHLLLHSFKHIPWSTADLYLLPVDFALAPYWLVTQLPNKLPQGIFFLGMVLILLRLVGRFSKGGLIIPSLALLTIFGSHLVTIQMGTAMLDMTLCYLFFAALESFLSRNTLLAAAEGCFYFWSKSFLPVQMILIAMIMLALVVVLRRLGFKNLIWFLSHSTDAAVSASSKRDLIETNKKFLVSFLLMSVLVGGPFVVKSIYYTGTPLFPFVPGSIPGASIEKNPSVWKSLKEKAHSSVKTRDQYGSGRSPLEFARHLWLIAVPEKGVNNRYDYPVGLPYLLFVGPFLVFGWRAWQQKTVSLLALFIVGFWLTWWMGSQQSRFLFIPLMLMILVVLAEIKNPSRVFLFVVLLCVGLESLSVYGALKGDWGRRGYDVLRDKDKDLIGMSKPLNGKSVILNFPDVAYADFPVEVIRANSVFVLDH